MEQFTFNANFRGLRTLSFVGIGGIPEFSLDNISLSITRIDTDPPVLSVPASPVLVEATGPTGAIVTFDATAHDDVDGSVLVIYSPASGSTFPLGTTSVNGVATDDAGNSASGSFTVWVQDTTAPALTLPSDITVFATSAAGAPIPFHLSAVDVVDGSVPVTASATSGNVFPIGTTTVSCSSQDTAGNEAQGSFNITVRYADATVLSMGAPTRQILQPINLDGSSVFKQGSAVPAKFRVADISGNSIGSSSVVTSFRLTKVVGGIEGSSVNEAVVSTTPDTAFRWDATAQQWVFNIKTKEQSAGWTYFYEILLNDGTTISFRYGLR